MSFPLFFSSRFKILCYVYVAFWQNQKQNASSGGKEVFANSTDGPITRVPPGEGVEDPASQSHRGEKRARREAPPCPPPPAERGGED